MMVVKSGLLCFCLFVISEVYSRENPFDPAFLLRDLPSLRLPYVDSIRLPQPQPYFGILKPSPLKTVTNVITNYVTRNPICVKTPKLRKKRKCHMDGKVKEKVPVCDNCKKRKTKILNLDEYPEPFFKPGLSLEGSENFFGDDLKFVHKTPELSVPNTYMEDKLHLLDNVLSHYTKVKFHTDFMTVWKTVDGSGETATLLAKNCLPEGIQICPAEKPKH